MLRSILNILIIILPCMWITSAVSAQVPIESMPFWSSGEEGVYSTGMIWRDCNNDGYIDVFFSTGNDIVRAQNSIYLSDFGTLPTTASWFSANAEYSGHCTVGDIDDDGFADFAVANFLGADGFSTANYSNIYMNSGGLPSTTPDWYSGDSIYTFSCALGDADGDGDLDLAFACGEGYNNKNIKDKIYYNVGGEIQTTPGWESDVAAQSMDVTWGDVNNDGYLDLAFCYDNRPPAIYYNSSTGLETTPSWQAADNESGNTIIFGDVNSDGWLDVIVAFNSQLGGSGRFKVYYNNGLGLPLSSAGWESSTGGYGSGVSLYDYDNDGDPDLCAGRWWDNPRLYENTGVTFTTTPVWQAGINSVVEELAWVDIDGDGVELISDTIGATTGKKVYYTRHNPLYAIDSVVVDGVTLSDNAFCYDLISGWISLGAEPSTDVVIHYQYSFKNDMTVANWDYYNLAYGNLRDPLVNIYASQTIGWAPLAIAFTDSSIASSNHYWNFGDGAVSTEAEPLHTYDQGGAFDVYCEVDLADGRHRRRAKKMVITLADTLFFPELDAEVNDTIKVTVGLANSQPLKALTLPVKCGGDVNLKYLTYDTDGCRTDYFDLVDIVAANPSDDYYAFSLLAASGSSTPALPPGKGDILNIYFEVESGGVNPVDTVAFSGNTTYLEAGYLGYKPAVVTGSITVPQLLCGDANGDDVVNIGDAVFIVNYIFKGGPAPDPIGLGDANCDGPINVGDAVYIVNYIFKSGPAPCCP